MVRCIGKMAATTKDNGSKAFRMDREFFSFLGKEPKRENSKIMYWSSYYKKRFLMLLLSRRFPVSPSQV